MRERSSNPQVIQQTIRILGICLLTGILIYLLMKKPEGISVAVKNDHLSLIYSTGDSFEIRYKDILSVVETQDLDPGKYVSGIETKKHKFGVWENNEFGKYHLCIYANIERYIVVKTPTEISILNLESVDVTDNFYKAFMELLQRKQTEAAP
jgi:hypothetical protein